MIFFRSFPKTQRVKFYFSHFKPVRNFYQVLGINPKSATADVKDAYYKLAKQHHPDTATKEQKIDPAIMQAKQLKFNQIYQAYSILSDPETRRQYDLKLGFRNQQNYQHPYNNNYAEQASDPQAAKQRRKQKQERRKAQFLREEEQLKRVTNMVRAFFVISLISGLCWWLIKPSPQTLMTRGIAPKKNTII